MKFDDLVKKFADEVIRQNESADARTANKHATAYIAAFNELRSYGDEGREALSTLLTHGRAEVRVKAAAYLLRYCEQRARAVLEAEAKGPGLVAFGAAQALQRWQEGTWELDPE